MPQKFLVVDDDVGSATLMAACLTWFLAIPQANVIECYHSPDALKYLGENAIDVLITDYCMPAIDGLTLIKKARELRPEILTVLVSASVDLAHDANVQAVSPNGRLSKPFDVEQFADLVRDIANIPMLTQGTLLPEVFDDNPSGQGQILKGY